MNAKNEGVLFTSRYGADIATFTAGGTTDNALNSTDFINKSGFHSAKVIISYDATIGSNKALHNSLYLVDSNDSAGSTILSLTCVEEDVTVISLVTGAEKKGTHEVTINDLDKYGDYIAVGAQLNLTNTNTDTCKANIVVVLCGAEVLPAS
jgi:hypothetical protein